MAPLDTASQTEFDIHVIILETLSQVNCNCGNHLTDQDSQTIRLGLSCFPLSVWDIDHPYIDILRDIKLERRMCDTCSHSIFLLDDCCCYQCTLLRAGASVQQSWICEGQRHVFIEDIKEYIVIAKELDIPLEPFEICNALYFDHEDLCVNCKTTIHNVCLIEKHRKQTKIYIDSL
jgi:hypothetical protein